MHHDDSPEGPSRRRFLQYLAVAAAGGRALLQTAPAAASVPPPSAWPALPKRVLGRTGFAASRLIFGCGAALSRARRDDLLEAAWAAGINVFDVGHHDYYADAEAHLAPFLRGRRDRLFLISKARVGLDLAAADSLGVDQARGAANTWSTRLDESLATLGVERLDAYYVMAVNNAGLVASDEILGAFTRAKAAGKVDHLGLSTHENQQAVLEAAMATGSYSLAMIGLTPAGWYDLPSKSPLAGAAPLTELQPFLERLRAAGIGLIGMKAARFLAGGWMPGSSRPGAFDARYDEKLLASPLTPFQRSYAYVLEHGLDVVNADMQQLEHLHQNVVAAASSASFGDV
jgi:aryl-alcohol dehydrogenase-like predicted oxidoreductase